MIDFYPDYSYVRGLVVIEDRRDENRLSLLVNGYTAALKLQSKPTDLTLPGTKIVGLLIFGSSAMPGALMEGQTLYWFADGKVKTDIGDVKEVVERICDWCAGLA